MKKQVYTFQKQLTIPNNQFGKIILSFSKYSDCLFIFINQTGAIGSIIEGEVSQSSAELLGEDQYEQQQKHSNFIYEIKGRFGSTQMEFYDLLLRRIMSIIWEEMKIKGMFKVIMNVSLPILHPNFEKEVYYQLIVQESKFGLKEVL